MKKSFLFKLVFSGLCASLVFIFTAVVSIPLPLNGYANLGDCFVILAGAILGPVYGAAAAAVGSLLADLFLGYAIYAPATFVIKGLMAFLVGILLKKGKTSLPVTLKIFIVAIISEITMVAGYFIFEFLLYGLPAALSSIIGNCVQGVVAIICSVVLYTIIHSSKIIDRLPFNTKK